MAQQPIKWKQVIVNVTLGLLFSLSQTAYLSWKIDKSKQKQ